MAFNHSAPPQVSPSMPDDLPPEPNTESFTPSDRGPGSTIPPPGLPDWASDPDSPGIV